MNDLHDLLDPVLDARHKGWPHGAPALRRSEVGRQGWHLLRGDLPLPMAVIREDALAHNLQWMQRFCDERGVGLAPHGKTTMSPQLFARQLEAGAWGLTVANVMQLRIAVASGVRRALVANQVVQAQDLAAIDRLQQAHPDLRVLFLIDAPEHVAAIEAARPAQPFEVLVELGFAGGRTGCRTHAQALALARAAAASPAVRLAGVECYEGGLAHGQDDAADAAAVADLLQRAHAVLRQCQDEGLLATRAAGDALVISAGGSAVFDLVATHLRPALGRPVQGLLRSGCYLTHDDGNYRRYAARVNRRIGCADAAGLRAALQVWAVVQSVPEPGLALLSAGRRDLSFDIEMPIPVAWSPRGSETAQPAPPGWQVSALNDQHAYLRTNAVPVQIGDRVALGISHPCTTFDKWRWMAVVDADHRVVDAIVTYF